MYIAQDILHDPKNFKEKKNLVLFFKGRTIYNSISAEQCNGIDSMKG